MRLQELWTKPLVYCPANYGICEFAFMDGLRNDCAIGYKPKPFGGCQKDLEHRSLETDADDECLNNGDEEDDNG